MDAQTAQQMQQLWSQYWYYFLLAGFVIGLILGLIPFFLGRRKGQAGLGLIALIVTAVVGTPSIVLGLVSCVVFTVIVLIRGRSSSSSGE